MFHTTDGFGVHLITWKLKMKKNGDACIMQAKPMQTKQPKKDKNKKAIDNFDNSSKRIALLNLLKQLINV